MEFQFCSLTIEERYPRAVDMDASSLDELRLENGHRTVKTCTVEKKTPGCVAFLWGRTSEGQSICVRTEGVRPVLFFEMSADDTLRDLCTELEEELTPLKKRGDISLMCTERTFCHFMGYEPDPTTVSRRKEHRYAEVTYPSLTTWRLAVRLRKHQDIFRLRDKVCALKRVEQENKETLERLRVEASKNSTSQLVQRYKKIQTDSEKQTKTYELYSNRLASHLASWDDFENEHGTGDEDETRRVYREAHEWFVDPTTRFLQENNLTPSRWIRIERPDHCKERVSVCDFEVQCSRAQMCTIQGRDDNAPTKTCYYDIETTGLEPSTAEVIQVSLVFRQGDEKKRILVGSRDYDPIPNVVVYAVSTEAEVLATTQRIILEEDPDSLVSYNGVNFDNPFLRDRADKLGLDQFFYLSRFALKRCNLRELKLQSSGMGDNLLRYFDTPGRSNYDWYVKLKRDLTQEDSYKLDYMAKKFCGKSKVELASGLKWRRMTATMDRDGAYELTEGCGRLVAALQGGRALYEFSQEQWCGMQMMIPLVEHHWVRVGEHCYAPMNTKHRAIIDLYNGTSMDRARLGYYCVEDSEILDDLNTARVMMVEIYQFSGVFGIVPEWVYFRGQQVRFISQILRKARVAEATPLLMNRPPDGFQGEDRAGYDGAVVNDPIKGFHKRPVGTLDWKSLYPAIMISANLCHSTCVINPGLIDMEGVQHYDISPDYRTHFVSEKVHRGILPQILEELAVERKNAKGMVKKALTEAEQYKGVDDAKYNYHVQMSKVYDGRQLAVKVAMNSIYGACGTSVDSGAKFPCLDISATVTFIGREAMGHLKRILTNHFPGLVVVYGDTDSVMIMFPDVDDVDECGCLCEEAADMATNYFQTVLKLRAMELEFEKIFRPYLLEAKKRYMGLKFEPDGKGGMVCKGIDAKGVETERKDTLPYLKIIMREVRDALILRRDEAEALSCFRKRMDALVDREVPMELLTLKKNLSSKVAHKSDSIVHARVNRKRKEREAGSEAQVNEQVEYVILNEGHKKSKTTDLAEDPAYAKEHSLELNYKWYWEHCIRDAMKKMLEYVPSFDYARLTREYTQRLEAKRMGVKTNVFQSLLKKRARE
tara:strand:+ start:2212 stop:5526 length:3315 start_codon:yes stop_codon:yes gene_type:complete